jgi:hypothetical protein
MQTRIRSCLELPIHNVRRQQQGALTQKRQLLFLDSGVSVRRRVYDDQFVRLIDEALRNGLGFRFADNAAYEVLLFIDVAEIDRRHH